MVGVIGPAEERADRDHQDRVPAGPAPDQHGHGDDDDFLDDRGVQGVDDLEPAPAVVDASAAVCVGVGAIRGEHVDDDGGDELPGDADHHGQHRRDGRHRPLPGQPRQVAVDTQPPADQDQDQDGAADLPQAHRHIPQRGEAAVVDRLQDQAVDPRAERAQDGAGRDE